MKILTAKILSLALALSCIAARAQDPAAIQGIDRDAKGVDASIHASVDDPLRLVPPQENVKQLTNSPASYGHWGFSISVGEPPTMRFWPAPAPPAAAAAGPPAIEVAARAKNATNRAAITGGVSFRAAEPTPTSSVWPAPASSLEMDARSDSNSQIVEPSPPDTFQSFAPGRPEDGSKEPFRFRAVVPRLSWQPETAGLPSAFGEKPFALSGGSSPFPSPFSQATFFAATDRAKAKPHKNRQQKSLDDPGRRGPRDFGAAGNRSEREKTDRLRLAPNAE